MAVGQHLLIDLHGVDAGRLRDESALVDLLVGALRQAGYQVLGHRSHKFEGGGEGVTACVLLSESHASIHTYPEHCLAAMDIFSCGRPDPQEVVRAVQQALQAESVRVQTFDRG